MEEPKVFNKYLVSLTKIISFYSFFFILIKSIAIIRGAWAIPNLILTLPFIAIGTATAYAVIYKKYNWPLAIIGVLIIIAVRYCEIDWVYHFQKNYSNG